MLIVFKSLWLISCFDNQIFKRAAFLYQLIKKYFIVVSVKECSHTHVSQGITEIVSIAQNAFIIKPKRRSGLRNFLDEVVIKNNTAITRANRSSSRFIRCKRSIDGYYDCKKRQNGRNNVNHLLHRPLHKHQSIEDNFFGIVDFWSDDVEIFFHSLSPDFSINFSKKALNKGRCQIINLLWKFNGKRLVKINLSINLLAE